jgi:hypothetical protein
MYMFRDIEYALQYFVYSIIYKLDDVILTEVRSLGRQRDCESCHGADLIGLNCAGKQIPPSVQRLTVGAPPKGPAVFSFR